MTNDNLAEKSTQPMWYIFRVQSGKEEKIADEIKRNYNKIESFDPKEYFLEYSVPKKPIIEYKDGAKQEKMIPSYPGYLFIKIKMIPEVHLFLRNVLRNLSLITKPITESQYQAMLDKVNENINRKNNMIIKIGQSVQITSGSFNTMTGVVKHVNDQDKKLKVAVPIFGQEIDVEIDYDSIKVVNNQ